MKTYNLCIQYAPHPGVPPNFTMCCFTIPDETDESALTHKFITTLASAKAACVHSGSECKFNSILCIAQKAVEDEFDASMFLVEANGAAILRF